MRCGGCELDVRDQETKAHVRCGMIQRTSDVMRMAIATGIYEMVTFEMQHSRSSETYMHYWLQ